MKTRIREQTWSLNQFKWHFCNSGRPPDHHLHPPPDHHLHPPPDHCRTTAGPPSVHHLHPSAHWTTDAPPPDHRRTTTVYDDFTTTSSVSCEELNNEEEKFDQAQPQSELQNEVNNVELNNDQMELEQPVDHEKAQSDGNNDASVSLDLDDHEPSSVELNNDQEKSDQAQPAELLNEENTGGLKSDQMPTSRWGRRSKFYERLTKWLWRLKTNMKSIWKECIVSIHKINRKLVSYMAKKSIKGVWSNIANAINCLQEVNLDQNNLFSLIAGTNTVVLFWLDRWCDSNTLKIKFPLLYELESLKSCYVTERITDSSYTWKWKKALRGEAVMTEFLELCSILNNIRITVTPLNQSAETFEGETSCQYHNHNNIE
ncbi:hypothetical protein LXL04_026181 [Taraxacum kok-saghyz]